MLLRLSFTVLVLSSGPAFGRDIEKVNFPERIHNPELELNGVGLRSKRKYAHDWKIYVAALYVPKKTSDARRLMTTREHKIVDLVFLRRVDKAALVEAWAEGFKRNCDVPCPIDAREFGRFNDVMTDVRAGDRIRISMTDQDVVTVEVATKTKTKGEFRGEHMRRTVLATFIGDRPGSPTLRDGLLSLDQPGRMAGTR